MAPLIALGPRFSAARSAQDCVRAVVEEFGAPEREDDACVLVARVSLTARFQDRATVAAPVRRSDALTSVSAVGQDRSISSRSISIRSVAA